MAQRRAKKGIDPATMAMAIQMAQSMQPKAAPRRRRKTAARPVARRPVAKSQIGLTPQQLAALKAQLSGATAAGLAAARQGYGLGKSAVQSRAARAAASAGAGAARSAAGAAAQLAQRAAVKAQERFPRMGDIASRIPFPSVKNVPPQPLHVENTGAPMPSVENTGAPMPSVEHTDAPVPHMINTDAPVPSVVHTDAPMPTVEAVDKPMPDGMMDREPSQDFPEIEETRDFTGPFEHVEEPTSPEMPSIEPDPEPTTPGVWEEPESDDESPLQAADSGLGIDYGDSGEAAGHVDSAQTSLDLAGRILEKNRAEKRKMAAPRRSNPNAGIKKTGMGGMPGVIVRRR